MCLQVDPKLTKTKLFGKNRRRIVCWKVVKKVQVSKTTTILRSPYYDMPYGAGMYVSGGRNKQKLTREETENGMVSYGIHVFLNLKDAEEAVNYGLDRILIKVICHRDDFVAAGIWDARTQPIEQAVFMKVFVPLDCDDLNPKEIATACV